MKILVSLLLVFITSSVLASGTGFVINQSGYVVTNAHVSHSVLHNSHPKVLYMLINDKMVIVKHVATSSMTDLSLLKIVNNEDIPPYCIKLEEKLLDNDEAVYPILYDFKNKDYSDILKKKVRLHGGLAHFTSVVDSLGFNSIPINVAVFPGNSGSPVLSVNSKLVGVIYATNTDTKTAYMTTQAETLAFIKSFTTENCNLGHKPNKAVGYIFNY